MVSPLLESRGFVALKLRAHLGRVVEANEPVLVGITVHAAIPSVEDFPSALQMEPDGRDNLRTDLLIIDIPACLVILLSSGALD